MRTSDLLKMLGHPGGAVPSSSRLEVDLDSKKAHAEEMFLEMQAMEYGITPLEYKALEGIYSQIETEFNDFEDFYKKKATVEDGHLKVLYL